MSAAQSKSEVTPADVARGARLVRRLSFVLVPVTAIAVAVQVIA